MTRNAARNVPWSAGAPQVERRGRGRCALARGARPYRRSRLLVMPVVQRGGRRPRSAPPRAIRVGPRCRDVSRSCSDGRTVFFNGQAKGMSAPDRRHTRGLWRFRPSAQPACDPDCRRNQIGQGQCRCGSSMQRGPCRWTRDSATSPVSRSLFRCRHPRPAQTRYFAATIVPPSDIAVDVAPAGQIHRIGTHQSSCIRARRRTTTAPGSTRPI